VRNARIAAFLLSTAGLTGCSSLEFDARGPGLTYFEPVPYLAVSKTADCKVTASIFLLPGAKKTLAFHSGYGSADLSATLAGGMLQSVGQKTDTKVPETITAVAGLAGLAAARAVEPGKPDCSSSAYFVLYPIKNGDPDFDHPMKIPNK